MAWAAPSMNCAFGMKPLPVTVKSVDVPTLPPVRLRLVSVGSGMPVYVNAIGAVSVDPSAMTSTTLALPATVLGGTVTCT